MAQKRKPLAWRKRRCRRSLKLPTPKPLFTRLGFEPLEHRWLLSVTPLGSEFQVNTTTAGPQYRPAVASDSMGNFVTVWQDNGSGDSNGIFAQRFNQFGEAQGAEFLVNTVTANIQSRPSVAMDADGDFVVVWQSDEPDTSAGIYGQRYNSAGVVQGGEFHVNTYTTSSQTAPTVAMDDFGNFIIAWESFGQDGASWGVYGQRFDAAGTAQGAEFRVNTTITSQQREPAVAMDADGDFVIAWQSNQDGSGYGVYAQRYNAAGEAQGSEFLVNTYTSSSQLHSSVAMDADGDFVIAWQSSYGQDGSGHGNYAQRYNAAGVAQSGEFLVNTSTSGNQKEPSVGMDADGNFVVVWVSSGQDGSGEGIYAQRFDAAGVAQDAEFRVNTNTVGDQAYHEGFSNSVAMDSSGDFVVVWISFEQDGDHWGVYAQRYGTPPPPPGTSAGLDEFGNLVIDDILAGGKDDSLVITLSGSNVRIHDPNNGLTIGDGAIQVDYNTVDVGFASVTGQVLINTGAGSDTLTFDFSGGNPIPLSDVVFDGGADGNDVLELVSGSFTDVTYTYTGPNDGSVVLDGSTISYTGLEPITSSVAADTVELVFTGGSETITLADAGGGMTTVDSTLGETTTFANPTSQLRVMASNGSDIIDVDALASGYASLEISGDDVADVVNFNGPLTLGADRNFFVHEVGSINLTNATSDLTTIGDGAVSLTALRNIFLWENSSISSGLGDITLSANQQETPASGNFTGISVGSAAVGATITSAGGNVSLLGRGGDGGASNEGVVLLASQISGGGVGTVTSIVGRGGGGGGFGKEGVTITNGSQVTSSGGDVQLTGFGGTGSAGGAAGFKVGGNSQIAAGGTGTIVVAGTGGGAVGSSNNYGIYGFEANIGSASSISIHGIAPSGSTGIWLNPVGGSGTAISSASNGPVTLIADSMAIGNTSSVSSGSGTVSLLTQTAGTAIDLGGADAAGTLGLTVTELDRITAGTLVIGEGDTGSITISATITRPSTTQVELHSGGAILFDPGSLDTAGGNLMLAPGTGGVQPVTSGIDAAANTVSFASDLRIVIDGTALDTEYTQLNVDGAVDLAGVDLVLSGVYVPAPGDVFTIISTDSVTGEFNGLTDGATLVFNGSTLTIDYSAIAVTLTRVVPPAPLGLFVADGYQEVDEGERLVENPTQLIVAFDEELSTAGGASGPNSITNPANWLLTKDTLDISGQITSTAFEFDATWQRWEATVSLSAVLTDGDYELTIQDSVEDLSGNALDGDFDANPGGDFVRTFNVRVPTALGSEQRVNTTMAGPQELSAVASDAAGNYVVVWSGNGPGDGGGIFGQRYNAAGMAQGSEFRVSTFTGGIRWGPTVAMDDNGDFVVAWVSSGQDGSSDGVYAQRFNAAGEAQGSEFLVNTNTAGQQNFPSVAIDADGDFVVVWRSQTGDGSGYGIYAQRYDAAGVAQGGEFRVNTTTASEQREPAVAMDADGNFVVAWQSNQDGSGYGIYAQRYDAAGVAQGGEFLVNTYTTSAQREAAVSMDADGNFVVAWQSLSQDSSGGYGVYAQRYNAAGVAQGSEFRANTYTSSNQSNPSVTMDDDGDFVVTWQSYGQDGSNYGIYAQRYDAAGVAQDGEFRVNTFTGGTQWRTAAAMDADGDFVVVWQSNGQDGDNWGVYAQRYGIDVYPPAPLGLFVADGYQEVSEAERLVETPTELIVAFDEELSTAGGAGGPTSITNPANWLLTKDSVDISGQITGITFEFDATWLRWEATVTLSAALTDGEYELTLFDAVEDLAGNALDGDGDTNPGGDFVRTFSSLAPVAVGGEFRGNTTTSGLQQRASVAADAAGNYVVVWNGYGPGTVYGIFAQRYNADGMAQGSEFRVNTTLASTEDPSVAMNADGAFVVTWRGNSTVYVQRYDAAGVAQGSEIPISGGIIPTVAIDPDGDFVVSWYAGDAHLTGIYAQRYDANGVAQGGVFQVNTYTSGRQEAESVAMDAAGNFVIAWMSEGQDGSGFGVYAQRYNAAGVAQGAEFRVNTYTAGNQWFPTVAMDTDGDFVVAWHSNQDGSGFGIYAQRYNAAGVAQGGEFLVNTQVLSDQNLPAVAMDADGDFVIAWQSLNQDGSSYGIYAQRYNAAGVAQGAEFRVNTFIAGNQSWPAVAMDADGDFVVVWESDGQDGDSWGIYAQRYGVITNQPPSADAGGPYTLDLGQDLTLDGSGSTDPDIPFGDSIVSYQWDLDNDGQFDDATGQQPLVPWATLAGLGLGLGTHTIGLQVTDSFGATDSDATTLSIYDNRPFASFTAMPNPAAPGQVLTFDANGSYHGRPDRQIVSYEWDFGDGQTASGVQVFHAYTSFDSYVVQLTVTDNNVPARTDSEQVLVDVSLGNHSPSADAGGPYTLDLGQDLTLDGSGSTDPDIPFGDSIVSYQWDLDNDGQFDDATGQQPLVPWATLAGLGLGLGTHTIGLQVTDSFGATDSDATTLSIYDNRPFASLTVIPDEAPSGQSLLFDGSASYHGRPDRQIVKYEFVFGDGNTYIETPTSAPDGLFDGKTTHAYGSAAEYEAQLIVTDNNAPARTDSAVALVSITPVLFGDYNDNGKVDAADYTVWRDTLSAGGTVLLNDPTPGIVDESDFLYWRAHFGETLPMGGSGASASTAAISPSVQETTTSLDFSADAPSPPSALETPIEAENPEILEAASPAIVVSPHEDTTVRINGSLVPPPIQTHKQILLGPLGHRPPTNSSYLSRRAVPFIGRPLASLTTFRSLDLLFDLELNPGAELSDEFPAVAIAAEESRDETAAIDEFLATLEDEPALLTTPPTSE